MTLSRFLSQLWQNSTTEFRLFVHHLTVDHELEASYQIVLLGIVVMSKHHTDYEVSGVTIA